MANIGKSITQSATFLSKVGAECELLAALVKQELSGLFTDRAVRKGYQVGGEWADSYGNDDMHGWVCVRSAHCLPLIIKPKRSIGAYLFFQISLAGDGVAAIGNDEPLVHVGLWSLPLGDECYMAFPLTSGEDNIPSLDEGKVFNWPQFDLGWQEWNYSLRLAEINTVQDVRELIVEPVQALLQGDSASDALPHSLRGVVRYSAVEGELGQYRVEQ